MYVASHQPVFLPWLGFWHKFQQADLFVFSAGVQLSKSDVCHRVRLGGSWFTVPLCKGTRELPIRDVQVVRDRLPELAKRLRASVSPKAENYGLVEDLASCMEKYGGTYLLDLNVRLLELMARCVPDPPELCVDFRNSDPALSGTERLFARIERHVAVPEWTYLAGRGALDYLQPEQLPPGVSLAVQRLQPDVCGETAVPAFARSCKPVDLRALGSWEDV